MNENYKYYMKTDLRDYIGEWVAICNKKVVAHGKNLKRVMSSAKKKYPKKEPLVVWMPEKGAMLF